MLARAEPISRTFMDDFPNDDGGLLATEAPVDNAPALSVSELSMALARAVEKAFGHVRARGEISGWKTPASGRSSLTLKDESAGILGFVLQGPVRAHRFRTERKR